MDGPVTGLSKDQQTYFLLTEALHRNYQPHSGQVPIVQALFSPNGATRVFVRCGRKFGKTTIGAYCLIRKALFEPGSRCYYLTPLKTQADEIVWSSGLLTNFILTAEELGYPTTNPLIKHIDKQKMRITFFNDSFIKVDGSDNIDAQRGWNPDMICADEFAEFHPDWAGVMIPNLLARKATIIILGTPPRFPVLPDGTKHQYVIFDEEFQKEHKAGKRTTFHIYAPTWVNPHNDKEWLEEEKQRLYDRGDGIVWEREYAAKIVLGDRQAVFPMYAPETHLVDHDELRELILGNPDRYEWFCSADPGTKSVFSVVFAAIDRYTSSIYLLDEIYERDPGQTTTRNIVPRIQAICEEWNEDLTEWQFIADSAAAWFIQDAFEHFDLTFTPTEKQSGDKQDGISTIKDILLHRDRIISDRCTNTSAELQNYRTDDKGRILKEHDHAIDNFRYILKASMFTFIDEEPPKTEAELYPEKRFWTMEEDYRNYRRQQDPFLAIVGDEC